MSGTAEIKRRVRNGTWLWAGVAFAFYFAFIAVTVYRSRH
jgi:hypothetical protein